MATNKELQEQLKVAKDQAAKKDTQLEDVLARLEALEAENAKLKEDPDAALAKEIEDLKRQLANATSDQEKLEARMALEKAKMRKEFAKELSKNNSNALGVPYKVEQVRVHKPHAEGDTSKDIDVTLEVTRY